jgi:hypothetical protein
MEKCEYCNDTGYINTLINYSGFHINGEYPEYEQEPCEYCEVEND